jgi:hypothetical protein
MLILPINAHLAILQEYIMNLQKFRLYCLYGLIYPGLKKLGDPYDADVIAVQAFGRNNYLDHELPAVRALFDLCRNDPETVKELRDRGFDPGEPNRQLAKAAMELADEYNLPIITQWEVAAAFDPDWYKARHDSVICLWPSANPKEYFTTREVKKQTAAIMKRHGWSKPLELSHQRMIVRAVLILFKLGVEPIVSQKSVTCFDRHSSQKWTTSLFWWLYRESQARIHHLLHQWV